MTLRLLLVLALAVLGCVSRAGLSTNSDTRPSLSSLRDGDWLFVADSELAWQRPDGSDAEYRPLRAEITIPVRVCDDARRLLLDYSGHGDSGDVYVWSWGSRDRIVFEVQEGWPTEFEVWSGEKFLQAELSRRGSGVWIVDSYRGRFVPE